MAANDKIGAGQQQHFKKPVEIAKMICSVLSPTMYDEIVEHIFSAVDKSQTQ